MNKTYLTVGIIALVAIVAVFFLYAQMNQPNPVPATNQTNQPNPPINNPTPTDGKDVVSANNLFAMDLYGKYKSEEGNMFFSPHSISSALAMTLEGAKGQTAKEMQDVLHLPDNQDTIRSDFLSINNELNKADKSYNLSVANALWAQNDFPFLNDYFSAVDKYYGGKATNLNFKTDTENSRLTINNWVEDKTNDRIKDLIPKGSITLDTRMVLTNAIYFKANWTIQFDLRNTVNDTKFELSSGDSANVQMMHETSHFNYGETNNLQILEMSYLGNDLSMLVILPKDKNLNALESSISKKNLDNWKAGMKDEKVEVSLPKFKFETKYFMAPVLKGMGMPTAFNQDNADFTGMFTRTPETGNLYISEVIHQTFVEVAEYGTEAAAATAVIMAATSMPQPEETKIFNADHPFIFVIQQKSTGNILFMGRMSNPSA